MQSNNTHKRDALAAEMGNIIGGKASWDDLYAIADLILAREHRKTLEALKEKDQDGTTGSPGGSFNIPYQEELEPADEKKFYEHVRGLELARDDELDTILNEFKWQVQTERGFALITEKKQAEAKAAIQALFLRIVEGARPANRSGELDDKFRATVNMAYNAGLDDYAKAIKQRIEKEKL